MVEPGNDKAHDQEEDQTPLPEALSAHRGGEGLRGRDRERGVQRTKAQAPQIVQISPQEACAETREAIRLATLAELGGKALYDHARAATKAVGLTCRIGDERLPPCFDALMGEFWFRTAPAITVTHSDHIETRIPGIMQFTLYAREAQDQQRAIVVANRLKETMEKQVWQIDGGGCVETEAMRVQVLKRFKVGRCVTVVDGGFDATCNG